MPRMKKGSVRPRGAPLKLIVASASEAGTAQWVAQLERAGFPCEWVRVERRDDFADRIVLFPCDAVLYDDALARAGLKPDDALLLLRERNPLLPLVVLSDADVPGAAEAAIAAGAADWVAKPPPNPELEPDAEGKPDRLPAALARALRLGRLLRETRRGDELLGQTEDKLRAVLDQSPDVVLILQGVTGTILRANRAAFLLLGRDEQELAGKHFSVLLPPDADSAGLLERLRAGAARAAGAGRTGTGLDGAPLLASHPFRDAAGHDVPMDVVAAPLPWGTTRALLCTLRDVGARDASDEARFRAEVAVERAAGAVIWTDAAGRVCGATATACARLGYPLGGLDGLSLAEIEPGLGRDLWKIHWDELRHYGTFRMEMALRRRDGTPLSTEAEVSLLSYRGREWRCAVLQAPALPGAAEQAPDPRLALLHHAPDVLARLDPRGAIVEFVGAAAAMLGDGPPTREALAACRGTPLASWAHPDDAPAVAAALERARHEPLRPARVAWRAQRPGGGALVLETLFVNRLADPALRGFLAATRDITERRLAEESLLQREEELQRANDELRRAARRKDEFLAGLGHELRTPLNAVVNLAEALQEGIHGPLSPPQVASLETIRGGGRHLLAVLGDLLDLARIEAGKLDLTWEIVEVAPLCRAALDLVGEAARRKAVALALSDSEPGLRLRADPRRLRQALLNLLANAVAFTPEGGAVRLEVERDAARGAVLFHVVDSGIGIDPADLSRLFQPFVQLPGGAALARRRAGAGPGSGLGLSLVSRLVRLHHGAVEVDSTPGRGSRFTVLLPASLPHDEDEPEDPDAHFESGIVLPDGARPLVLLAGDDGENARDQTLAEALAGAGYRVATARGGLETVEMARALRPDLVVLDTRLDERGGLGTPEVIRRLRADRPAPVAALASLSVPGDREACLAAGAAVYLRLPLPGRRLAERLDALLRVPAARAPHAAAAAAERHPSGDAAVLPPS